MTRHLLILLLALLLPACTPTSNDPGFGDGDDDDSALGDDDTATDDDATTTGDDDDDTVGDDDDDTVGDDDDDDDDTTSTGDDDDSAAGVSIHGQIGRSVSYASDGIGALVIVVLDQPFHLGDDPTQVALVSSNGYEDVNIQDPTALIPYAVEGLAPRPAPYYVVAIFADDTPAQNFQVPLSGDLLALDNDASFAVVYDGTAPVPQDMELNTVVP